MTLLRIKEGRGNEMNELTINGVTMSMEAAKVVEWAGVDPASDVAERLAGTMTGARLLDECLAGAEGDAVQGWREYVAAIEAAVAQIRGAK